MIKNVCVFASSSNKLNQIYYKDAAELGAMSESEDMTSLQEKLAADCSGSQCSTPKPADSKKCAEDDEYYEDTDDENDKQAADYTEEEILKQAYEIAEQKLASQGLDTIDYVISKVASDESLYGLANEESCAFIADKAEKLASLSEKTALEVVDDILVEVAGKLQ